MTLRIIAGQFKGRLLKAPKGPTTRPTQGMLREAVFNICQNEIGGARFLDPFAGSGSMGFEALSRGASHITLIEQNRFALSCIKENIALLQVAPQTTLIAQDATQGLNRLIKQSALFDMIYLDPPYDQSITPLFDLFISLLAPDAIVFLEERYNPKHPHKTHAFPCLDLKDTRRFGIALLSIFRYNKK